MNSIYPVNLMAPRSNKTRIIKGALFFTALLTVLVALFVVSGFSPCDTTSQAQSCSFYSQ